MIEGVILNSSFHFPPDLVNLLVDTIPRLNRSKKDLITFFQNVGVEDKFLRIYIILLNTDKDSFNKFNVTREILVILNQGGDSLLGVRRQLLQKVVCFDSFDVCWENDRDKAKANVSEIGKIVKLKDTVTRFEAIVEKEQSKRIVENEKRAKRAELKMLEYGEIKKNVMSLFSIKNPQERGKKLEQALNDLFAFYKISVNDAFAIYDSESGKCFEQIDGVVELNNYLTLVEMKWEQPPIGSDKVCRFISRLFMRANVDGIIISYSGFTDTAIKNADEALSQKVVSLVELQDIINILNSDKDLKDYFEIKLRNTKMYKNSFAKVDIQNLKDLSFMSVI